MADANALIASLLTQQRQRSSPFENQRKFGQSAITAGTSTAPLQSGSPFEGIARALQGALGGWMAHDADQQEQTQDQTNTDALSKASTATTPQSIAEALRGVKGGDMQAVLGQIVSGNLDRAQKQQNAGATLTSIMPGVGTPSAAAPAPAGGNPSPGGASNPNNVGNITNGQGGFTQPPTPQAGAADVTNLLRSYPVQYNNGQPMTLLQIGAKYAPADNGKDPMLKGNDPVQWAKNVASIAGVDPNQPLDFDNPAVVTAVTRGINAQEKGRQNAQPAPVIQQGVAQGMDPAAFGSQQGAPPQGAAPTNLGPPPVQQAPASSPAGNLLRLQAQRAQSQGDNVSALGFAQKAIEEDAKFATEAGKINLQGAEHDRQEALKQPQNDIENRNKSNTAEHNLRQEFDGIPSVKEYRKAATTFKAAVEAAKSPTPAADLNLVYAFATMMDPGSVVREGEMGMVKATQSASDQVKSMVAAVTGGQKLSPEARANLLDQMAGRYNSYKSAHDELAKSYEGFAERSQLNPQNVVARLPDVGYEHGQPKGGDQVSRGGEVVYDINGRPIKPSGKR